MTTATVEGQATDPTTVDPATAEVPATPETDAAVELTDAEQAEVDAQFKDGFGDPEQSTPPAPAEGENKPAAAAAEPAVTPPAPKYVQVTEDELKELKSGAATIAEIKATLDGKVFGRIGGLERTLKELQASTPSGEAITLTVEDFEEMKEDFPQLAEMTVKGMNRLLGKLRGTAKPAAETGAPAGEPVDIEKRLKDQLVVAEHNTAQNILSLRHENWREVVGLSDDGKEVQTPYRDWLAKQPVEYQTSVGNSWDPLVIAKSIDKFKAATATPAAPPTDDARNRRLRGAVPPKGSGGLPAGGGGAQTEEQGFNEGFTKG